MVLAAKETWQEGTWKCYKGCIPVCLRSGTSTVVESSRSRDGHVASLGAQLAELAEFIDCAHYCIALFER